MTLTINLNFYDILIEKKIYYSSYIRRFYNLYKDKSKIYKYVEKLKKNIE